MKLNLFILITIAVFFFQNLSCESSMDKITYKHSPQVFVDFQQQIVILPIILRYEPISAKTTLEPLNYQKDTVKAIIKDSTLKILSNKGLEILEVESLLRKNSKFKLAYHQLNNEDTDLFRTSKDEKLINTIKAIGKSTNYSNLLVLYLKVKVGPASSWNPFSGQIKSGISYSRIKAVLIESLSGTILWQNEIQFREIPKQGSSTFYKAINLLFTNLISKRNGGSDETTPKAN